MQSYNGAVVLTSHLQTSMNAEQYIKTELEKLHTPLNIKAEEDIESQIVRLLLSKKFRKYSAKPELIQHVKESVHYNINLGQPINLTFLHGAYKLWRLDEAPEADWAELFSLIYYSNYVKPICEIYKPGVWFDFFVDDWILYSIDNLTPEEVSAYLQSYQSIIDYLKPYQPANLKMTITPVGTQFTSRQEFNTELEKRAASLPLPKLSEAEAKMVELNVRPIKGQTDDPAWREKVYRIHNAYLSMKGDTGYHKNRPDKILTFNQPLPSGTTISLGTTKSSIAKFWVGVGALQPNGDSYRSIILTPNQLSVSPFGWEDIDLGLPGKNFKKIRVLN